MARCRIFRFGDITIKSGTRKGFLLTEKPNTEGGSVSQTITNYIDTDGAKYSDTYFAPRSFDIQGAILYDSESEKIQQKKRLINACNPKKEMEMFYNNGAATYYAKALTAALPDFGEEMNGVLLFCIPIQIPGFYWLSKSEIQSNIFEREKKIEGKFTFPMVFSERKNKATVVNNGDVATPPIFNIACSESIELEEIKIKNITTSKFLQLNYRAKKGETIRVDCDECTVTSSYEGNIINSITADSDFFLLQTGFNVIECTLPGATITSEHRNRYLGV